MMDIEKQTELLLRGTLFADEVEGWEAGAGSLAEAQGVPLPDASGADTSGRGVAAPALTVMMTFSPSSTFVPWPGS